MNLQQLRYFHKIAALKNYTKASEELFVAQSSLSHSMAKLEHELGVPLLLNRGVTLWSPLTVRILTNMLPLF